jgi:hypothetical protein
VIDLDIIQRIVETLGAGPFAWGQAETVATAMSPAEVRLWGVNKVAMTLHANDGRLFIA